MSTAVRADTSEFANLTVSLGALPNTSTVMEMYMSANKDHYIREIMRAYLRAFESMSVGGAMPIGVISVGVRMYMNVTVSLGGSMKKSVIPTASTNVRFVVSARVGVTVHLRVGTGESAGLVVAVSTSDGELMFVCIAVSVGINLRLIVYNIAVREAKPTEVHG